MKDTLLFILSHLVDHPDDLRVEEVTEDSKTIFQIQAHTEDKGKIIGKNGRIIKAVRDMMKLMATKQNVYVDVTLAE